MSLIPVMENKAEFSAAITSFFNLPWSFRNLEIGSRETFLIINIEIMRRNIFVETVIQF